MTDKLVIDARPHQSGLGAYTMNLVRELHDTFHCAFAVVAQRSRQHLLQRYCTKTIIVDSPMYSLREQLTVSARVGKTDVLHVPHYNIPLLYRGKLLMTIHDLTHLLDRHYKHTWKSRLYALPLLTLGARRGEHIFTVSEYTKRQIVEHLDVEPDKISVVHNGVGPEFIAGDRHIAKQNVSKQFKVDLPFILYVGSLKPHKNIGALLEAYAEFSSRNADRFDLVIVGNDQSGGRAINALAAKLRIHPYIIGGARTQEVADLYRAAEVLVLPSFEEGFGLPVIEAMSCGAPVICSNRASLPEIGAGAAMYFDPDDYHELTDALERLLQSPSLQDLMRLSGLERAKRFSWTLAAQHHLAVYQRFCA